MAEADPAVKTPKSPSQAGLTPLMLNHAAWVTHDVESTARFYTKVMGMELASTVYDDRVPSTGDEFPFFHIFFRMQDGSTIAFFEAPGIPARPAVTHPAYDIFDHFAFQAGSCEEVDRWRDWLVENGVDVVGPVESRRFRLQHLFSRPERHPAGTHRPRSIRTGTSHTEKGYVDLELWCGHQEGARLRRGATWSRRCGTSSGRVARQPRREGGSDHSQRIFSR